MKSPLRTWLLSGTLALTSLMPAHGAEPPRQSTLRVSYADLDLMQWPGVRTLYARIQDAALIVCGSAAIKSREPLTQVDGDCVRDTMSAAVYGAKIPRLAALYQTRTGLIGRR